MVYSVVFGSATEKEIASLESASRHHSNLPSLDLLWQCNTTKDTVQRCFTPSNGKELNLYLPHLTMTTNRKSPGFQGSVPNLHFLMKILDWSPTSRAWYQVCLQEQHQLSNKLLWFESTRIQHSSFSSKRFGRNRCLKENIAHRVFKTTLNTFICQSI